MSNLQYNIQFNKLCRHLQLGEMVGQEVRLSGGLLHRMYGIETTKGKYAVKALNPEIMSRPTAMKNYMNSEKIVNIVSNRNIPAIPAIQMNGIVVHNIDSQYYLVFPWVNGKSLEIYNITRAHCKKIGSILADIHSINFLDVDIDNDLSCDDLTIDWNNYLQIGRKNKSVWADLLHGNLENFYYLTSCANKAAKTLASDMVISHRDLDSKNVMWYLGNPNVIDWEAAGYVNPLQELTETALSLAGDGRGRINKDNFCAVISSYKGKSERLCGEWKTVLDSGFAGKFGWLEYNLKRSLGILSADEEEQNLGTDQVIKTIDAINDYASIIPLLLEWLNEEESKVKI
jgi:Ser/Thr protein kinase RdoA (MazF antagonist)